MVFLAFATALDAGKIHRLFFTIRIFRNSGNSSVVKMSFASNYGFRYLTLKLSFSPFEQLLIYSAPHTDHVIPPTHTINLFLQDQLTALYVRGRDRLL